MYQELLRDSYSDDDHFRLLVKDSAVSIPCVNPPALTKWTFGSTWKHRCWMQFQSNDLRCSETYWRSTSSTGKGCPFQNLTAHIHCCRTGGDGSLRLLFQVDPISPPRSDRNVRRITRNRRGRSIRSREHRLCMRRKQREHAARGRVYSVEVQERMVRVSSWHE